MTIEQIIPLNRLVYSKENVRRTGKNEGIGELAASIAAHGLRQNLNVKPGDDGEHFEVVAGGRRLRAMKQLVKDKKLKKDAPVNCLVLEEGEDPQEISLVENAMRTAMHPDDQFEAFRGLIEDKGVSVEEVAARFGVTPAVVRQRLKLANVSPKLRALFRKGEMNLEHVMALAISDDHAAQEAAWKDLPGWNRDPSSLKDALTHEAVPMTDRLAKFIGMDGYVAAGGEVVRDLFDEANDGYLTDRLLVMQLVQAKLEMEADRFKAEGWKWVRPEIVRDHGIRYGRVWPIGNDEDEEDESTEFATEDKARAGVILRLAYDGSLEADRGLIHPDDVKAEAKSGGGLETAEKTPSGFSAALVEDLTAHRTAALRIELARNPAVALAFTVNAMASGLVYMSASESCLAIRATSDDLERRTKLADDSPAHQAMKEEGERWGEVLPGDEADLLAWCLAQPQERLLDLLAFLSALTVDAVQTKQGRNKHHNHADRLAETLSLDMTQWWKPSAEGFFLRLPKAALAETIREANVPPVNFGNVKKEEAARLAAKALDGSGWLPEPLRVQG